MKKLKKYKKAYKEFEEWYAKEKFLLYTDIGFKQLPFEMQLGVFLKFLDEKGITYSFETYESDIANKNGLYTGFTDKNHKQKAISEAFKILENKLNK